MSKSYGIQANTVLAGIGVGGRQASNTGGAFVNVQVTDVFAAPLATSVSAATSLLAGAAGAGQLLTTGVTTPIVYANPAIPRNLTVWATGACTSAITITGTNQFDVAISEAISCNGAAIVAGTLVFKTITAISCAAYTVGAVTVSVGQGSILGSGRKMNSLAIDGAVYTTASGATTAVQETTRPVKAVTVDVHGVTFATALADTKTYLLQYGSSEAR
jgi:hypothetical protein